MQVVAALVIREMATRFGRKPGGYIWALLDPAAHIAFLSLIGQAIGRSPALGLSFPLFFATGYIGYQLYHASVSYLNAAIKSNKALLNYPNVAPIDVVTARFVLQSLTMITVSCFVLGGIISQLGGALNLRWEYLIEAVLAGNILSLGVSLANNVLFILSPLYEKFYGIITRPLFMLSGVFFLPDGLPSPGKEIILLNPVAHVVMLVRKGFYSEYRAEGLDIEYLTTLSFLALFVGLSFFTVFKKTLRSRD